MAKKTGKGAVGVPIASGGSNINKPLKGKSGLAARTAGVPIASGGSNINKPLKGKSGLAARTAHEVGLAHGKR